MDITISQSAEIVCIQCGKPKRLGNFPLHFNRNKPVCISCDKAPEQRARSLKHSYGMTLEEYDDLLTEQFGLCAICGEPPKKGTYLHVDHCHVSGVIRGLLCSHCNHMLGYARDNTTVLKNAIEYLKKHST